MLVSLSGHLSPSASTDSGSTRYSHLSLLSSSSISSPPSVSSSLPSPSPTIASIGSKTHAFFGSPFEGSPALTPPPSLYKRTGSLTSKASMSSITSSGSASASTSSDHDHGVQPDETPRIPQDAPRVEQRLISKRSLNEEFFGPAALPTPHSTSAQLLSPSQSRESSCSPPNTHRTLPQSAISRLFPSRRRYGSENHHVPEPLSAHRRGFIQLDADPNPVSHPGNPLYKDVYTTSPTATEFPSGQLDSNMPTSHAISAGCEHTSHVAPETNPKPLPPVPLVPAQPEPVVLEGGVVLRSTSLSLRLERVLGQGAFSSVWLARDTDGQVGVLEVSRRSSLLRSKSQKRGRPLEGTRPKTSGLRSLKNPKGPSPMQREKRVHVREREQSDESVVLHDEEATPQLQDIVTMGKPQEGRLVAVKMTERVQCEKNSRSRVSFVREVEILRHIAHPSIVSYVHSFSTPAHHCLVLEYVGGGELFDLIDNAESHARLDEPLLRRMFGELCRAVGWMHGVGLVHRDIKLENVLLTTSPFSSSLPTPPASLIKLSDFGLSRFIDPAHPLLTTLCGSESYAAPELVTGRPYDGRETDVWACGVVLYALAAGRLPFDRVVSRVREETKSQAKDSKAERRALLMRIAKAEFSWPGDDSALMADDAESGSTLAGARLVWSPGVRRIVERLLVRNPTKRAKIIDLWEDEWMRGEGAPVAPYTIAQAETTGGHSETEAAPVHTEAVEEPGAGADADPDADADAEVDDGLIVDEHDIGPDSVARQEH